MKRFGMRGHARYYGGVALVVVAAAVAVALAATTARAASNKPYSANVHQTLNTPGSFTLTLTNDPKASQTLGSANFTAPAGFVLGAVTGVGGTDASGFTVGISGNVVQFRAKSSSQALAKGQTVSADVTVTGGIAGCQSATWFVEAKQSNDFSGTPGNDMTLNPASDLTPLGSFEIADIGTPIAVTPFFTPSILLQQYTSTTTAFDTCHNVKGNYSGAALTHHGLTGATYSPNGGQTLSWSNGIGTVNFTPVVSETNNTITVTDPTTGIGDTSNFFDTQQKICTFADPDACAWQNGNGSIKASAPKPLSGSLGVGFDPVANVAFVCGGSGTALGDTVITIAPHDTPTDDYQVTIVYSKQVSGTGNANSFIFCISTDNGLTFTQLQACSTFSTTPLPDCIVDQKRVTGGALQVILNLQPGDPYVGGK
jgi:hypothetical protein